MNRRLLARLARMDERELAWRSRAKARTLCDRAAAAIMKPRWNRRDLASRLTRSAESLCRAADSLARQDFDEAHRALSRHFADAPQRFPISRAIRRALVERVVRDFPTSASEAAAHADRVLSGHYDLLGYRGLRFDGSGRFEWNYDPVHDRHAPDVFWTRVPYLDAACGDHKIIWQLNRHQHWLALGRAYWLTGEAKYRHHCLDELASWLERNPPLLGMNWTSMLELALRSLSWLWALHFFVDPDSEDASPWTVDLLLGVDRQLTHVERNLSYYFSPNTHLLGEALALYVAGRTLPELAASPRREAVGRRVLVDEIERQIAADGGHRERSAHYHRYTLDFYTLALVVARITRDPVADTFERTVGRLAVAARLLADDRGRLPHLGDDDGGVLRPLTARRVDDVRDSLGVAAALVHRDDLRVGALPEEELWMLAHPIFAAATEGRSNGDGASAERPARQKRQTPRTGWTSAALQETGYYVSRFGDGTHLVIDGGPHGYQNCGHAHADALSLTLTVRGLPLLIDPGTACYTSDLFLRDRMRSTAMHNTVTIDHRPQSTPTGPFHWSQIARARVERWRTNDGFDYFGGVHDGYAPVAHRRHVLAIHRDLLIVADCIAGTDGHDVAVHWHLDPRWKVEILGNRASLTSSTDRVGFFAPRGSIDVVRADPDTGLGWYSPVYGRVEPTRTIRVHHEDVAPFWMVSVFDLTQDNAVTGVDWTPVWAEAGTLDQSMALRISRKGSTDYFAIADVRVGARTDASATPSWRIAEFETDAHMLFCRTGDQRQLLRLALVDGSSVRSPGRRGVQLMLPQVVPDLHLDLSGAVRIAGPAFGAQLIVNGRECGVSPERRGVPRG